MREEGRGVGGATPLLHSNLQSWQMRSLPTLDPYRNLIFTIWIFSSKIFEKFSSANKSVMSGNFADVKFPFYHVY